MKHLFRIVSSIIVAALAVFALSRTYSWFWILAECIGWLVLCYLIIAIDEAKEMDDEEMEM